MTKSHLYLEKHAFATPRWADYQVRAIGTDAPPFPPQDIKSILVIKMDALGDYLLITPMITNLKQNFPTAKITWVCTQRVGVLARNNPDIDLVITPPGKWVNDPPANFMFGVAIQKSDFSPFDLILVPRWGEDWYLASGLACIVDAPYRLGYSARCLPLKEKHFSHYDDFYTHVIDDTLPTHEVWRGLQFCDALGAQIPAAEDIFLTLPLLAEDYAALTSYDLMSRARPLISLGVGGAYDFKRWSAENFSQLAKALHEKFGATIAIVGQGDDDYQAAAHVFANLPASHSVNAVGLLTEQQSAALLSQCDLHIGNDSFPMHAAAAVGTPVVEIIGKATTGSPDSEYLPRRFGPWGVPFCYIQPTDCNDPITTVSDTHEEPTCIAEIPVAAVLAAVETFLPKLSEFKRPWHHSGNLEVFL